jgi:hypothetical protein
LILYVKATRTWRISSSGWWRSLTLLNSLLFKYMVKEEWRLHQSLVGGLGSGLFPLMIFIITAFCAFITPYIIVNVQIGTILLALHIASVFYGVFVGGFGRIGEHVMTRKLGQVNMLLQLPQIYPIGFKKVMAVFYLKDSLYYLIYSYVPLTLGAAVAAPYAGVSLQGVAVLGFTMFLAFMMGMGLSFALSALSLSSKWGTMLISCLIISLIPLSYLKILPKRYVLPPLGYWANENIAYLLFSGIESAILAILGVLLMKERFEVRQRRYNESFLGVESKLGSLGDLGAMAAKEWLELVRSSSLVPAISGFSGHLLAIYAVSWLFQSGFGIPINFNVIFYSGFVGFMGVITYSFLTQLEHNEYLNVQPVSVDMVVKAKLVVYLIITSGVILGYVLLIGLLKNQLSMVPMGLIVSSSTSIFVVAVTAYLTGLWTNTMFFGAKTIIKFTAIVVPPLTLIEVAAMMIQFRPVLASQIVYGLSVVLLVIAGWLFSRLKQRWRDTSFSYVSTGV